MTLLEIILNLFLASFLILSSLSLLINLYKFTDKYNEKIQKQNLNINIFHLMQSQLLNKAKDLNITKKGIKFISYYCLYSPPTCKIEYIFNNNFTILKENNLTFSLPVSMKFFEKKNLYFIKITNKTLIVRKLKF